MLVCTGGHSFRLTGILYIERAIIVSKVIITLSNYKYNSKPLIEKYAVLCVKYKLWKNEVCQ